MRLGKQGLNEYASPRSSVRSQLRILRPTTVESLVGFGGTRELYSSFRVFWSIDFIGRLPLDKPRSVGFDSIPIVPITVNVMSLLASV